MSLNDSKFLNVQAEEKPALSCALCDKSFLRSRSLITHIRSHTDKCYLTVHKHIHIGEKPYSCNVCIKCFSSKSCLTNHRRVVHTDKKPFSSNVCSKCFSTRGNLMAHGRVHTGEKPFHCSLCNKSFSQKSTLTSHSYIHSKEKPYSCSVCILVLTHYLYS
nr:gastrula zinc finger protein XlCGF71.1-like [Parasteatoda tepidariorum]